MAPTNRAMQKQRVGGAQKNVVNRKSSGFTKNKRKWIPEQKVFDGSVQKGQGFAFKRRQKFQYEYKKLLRKEKQDEDRKSQFKDDYPQHLKHLYLAEAEKLRNEEKLNREKRRRGHLGGSEEDPGHATSGTVISDPAPLQMDSASPATIHPTSEEHSSFQHTKGRQKKTSYQKTREEYEKVQEKRARKKEEALRNKRQREEALRRYKEKKFQTYKVLSKKTKKGQPNLNLQMEYLLQKIQGQTP